MKIILGALILLSANLSAQEKNTETPKKSDTLKSDLLKNLIAKNPNILKSEDSTKINDIYKMPVAKPKDSSVYLSLKEKDKDYSKHKILNSIDPEKSKKEFKK